MESLALDPYIAALADQAASFWAPVPLLFVSQQQAVAGMAAMFCCAMTLVAAQAPYRASFESAMGARHLGYSEGAVRPSRRPTASSRAQAEAAKWGLVR